MKSGAQFVPTGNVRLEKGLSMTKMADVSEAVSGKSAKNAADGSVMADVWVIMGLVISRMYQHQTSH